MNLTDRFRHWVTTRPPWRRQGPGGVSQPFAPPYLPVNFPGGGIPVLSGLPISGVHVGPLPTFTSGITGLGRGAPHLTQPFVSNPIPLENARPRLSGLLIPPRIRRGYPSGVGSARHTRSEVRKGV